MIYSLSVDKTQECIKRIRHSIQNYFLKNNLTYAIFGKSEGLDSSVIAGLLSDLDGVKPIGVIMPCESKPEVEEIARLVLEHYKIPWIKIDLTFDFHALVARYYSSGAVNDQLNQILKNNNDESLIKYSTRRKAQALGNIKVRLRMITLYHIAQLTGGLVISTDNLSEYWTGFWTLNGDVGDFAPIQQIWKGLEEYAVAKALGVPEESIRAVPTDGLDVIPDGTDEDQLKLPYPDLDRAIIRLLQEKYDGSSYISEEDFDELIKRISNETILPIDNVAHVARQITRTNYKRHWPYVVSREEMGLYNIKELTVNQIIEKTSSR